MDKDQAKLLREVQALDFTLLDLTLYLDTHPYETEAIDYYRQCYAEYEHLVCDYERQYGPITPAGCGLCSEKWRWAMCPWPWDNKNGGDCHVEL